MGCTHTVNLVIWSHAYRLVNGLITELSSDDSQAADPRIHVGINSPERPVPHAEGEASRSEIQVRGLRASLTSLQL